MQEGFGPLEQKTMDAVWKRREADVREIVRDLGGRYAYTTIMTTLDRLYKKGYLERRKESRAYMYAAKMSREEMRLGLAGDMITSLIDTATRNAEPVLACIVDAVSERDRELLDDLERLVKEKKAALKN